MIFGRVLGVPEGPGVILGGLEAILGGPEGFGGVLGGSRIGFGGPGVIFGGPGVVLGVLKSLGGGVLLTPRYLPR